MATVAKTMDEVFRHLETIIEKRLYEIGERVRDGLKSAIKVNWYGRPGYDQNKDETDFYRRSWDLVNSVTVSPVKVSGDTYEVKIYFDYNKIHPENGRDGFWSQHQSILDDRAFVEGLVETVMYGYNPSKLYGWNNDTILEDFKQLIIEDKWLLLMFQEEFKKQGYSVKVG